MSRKSRQNKEGFRFSEMKLRVMAEYASSGIWVIGQIGVFRHGGIGHSALNLPPELSKRFNRWITKYWAFYDQAMFDEEHPELKGFVFDRDRDTFNQEGRELAHSLKAHMGPECYVEFQPELEEGLGPAEVIDLPT